MKNFKKLVPALCLMLISAMLLGTSTFAWFSLNKTDSVTGMEVKVRTSEGILIGKVGSVSNPAQFINQYVGDVSATLVPVSTVDGENFFYIAGDNVNGNGRPITPNQYLAYDEDTIQGATMYDDDSIEGWKDITFEIMANNGSDADKKVVISALSLTAALAQNATTVNAFRVALFVADYDGSAFAAKKLVSIVGTENSAYATADKAAADTDKVDDVKNYKEDLVIGTVPAKTETYFQVTLRVWLEGEDTQCNIKYFSTLDDTFGLDLTVAYNGTAVKEIIAVTPATHYTGLAIGDKSATKVNVGGVDYYAFNPTAPASSTVYADDAKIDSTTRFFKIDGQKVQDITYLVDVTTFDGALVVPSTATAVDLTTEGLKTLNPEYGTVSGVAQYIDVTTGTYYKITIGTKEYYTTEEEVTKTTTLYTKDANGVLEVATPTLRYLYAVTETLMNVTTVSGNQDSVDPRGGKFTAKFTADTNYVLPSTITVNVGDAEFDSANYTWDKATGTLTIPADKVATIDAPVEIVVTGKDAVSVTLNNTNVTTNVNDGSYEKGAQFEVTYTADAGYTLPALINVKVGGTDLTMGPDYGWVPASGLLTIYSNKMTGNVEVTVTGVPQVTLAQTFDDTKIGSSLANGVHATEADLVITYTATGSEKLKDTVTVTLDSTTLTTQDNDYTWTLNTEKTEGVLVVKATTHGVLNVNVQVKAPD